jgi:hypothetical protein
VQSIDDAAIDMSIVVVPPDSKKVVPPSLPSYVPDHLAAMLSSFLAM